MKSVRRPVIFPLAELFRTVPVSAQAQRDRRSGYPRVDREEAKVKFQDANRLFQAKQFDAALRVLQELNRAFPNERHVLYPLARCLTGLKRYPEAREIAQRLVTDFRYMPAQELVDRIDRLQAFEEPDIQTPTLPSGLDSILDTPRSFGSASKTPPPLPRTAAARGSWQPYALWIGLVLGGFISLLVLTLTVGRPLIDYYVDYFQNLEEYASNPDSIPSMPMGPYFLVSILNYAYSWVLSSLCGYAALRVLGALHFDDFGADMVDVGKYTFYIYLFCLVPVLGWIASLVILAKHYELGFGKLILTILLYSVFALVATLAYAIPYYGIIVQVAVQS